MKRMLAFTLCVVMLLSCAPICFASEAEVKPVSIWDCVASAVSDALDSMMKTVDQIIEESHHEEPGYGGTIPPLDNDDDMYYIPDGAYGLLRIPDIGISVPVYYRKPTSSDLQYVVDASNSAVWIDMTLRGGSQPYIADHNYQGFDALRYASVGTVAYLHTNNGTIEYYCVSNIEGKNTGASIITADGIDCMTLNYGGILLYTCMGGWQNVRITMWQP